MSDPVKVSFHVNSNQRIPYETKTSETIPEDLLNDIPLGDSFDDYLPYCKTAIKFGVKYRQAKKWLQTNVFDHLDKLFGVETTGPIPSTATQTPSRAQSPEERKHQVYQKQYKKLQHAYELILEGTFTKYSFYGLLAHRASHDLYASRALTSWTRFRYDSEQGLEQLHNKLVSRFAALPPSIIKELPEPKLLNQWGSYDGYAELGECLEKIRQKLDRLLDKYKEATQCDTVSKEEIDRTYNIHQTIRKLYAGGHFTIEEMLQFPAHKVKLVDENLTEYKLLDRIYILLEQHIKETEKVFTQILDN